uniref:Uncharacterized protein n=1 Tax=Arundo donax TaxID=35708 RepID=A0A0A9DGA7_ARUDO
MYYVLWATNLVRNNAEGVITRVLVLAVTNFIYFYITAM